MNGEEIATTLNVSRQTVNQTLQRGLIKFYKHLRKEMEPFDACNQMFEMLNVEDQNEMKMLISKFPKKIKNEIKHDATRR